MGFILNTNGYENAMKLDSQLLSSGVYFMNQQEFLERIEMIPMCGCWIWMRGCNNYGYGEVQNNEGIPTGAHRFAWELFKGPIPNKTHVLHHCDVPPCCNPYHLFLGVQVDNIRDMDRKSRRAERKNNNGSAKLTEAQVTAIYTSKEYGKILAARYGVSLSTIRSIQNHRSWTHLTQHIADERKTL